MHPCNVSVQSEDEVLVSLCVVCAHALAQRQLELQASHLQCTTTAYIRLQLHHLPSLVASVLEL